MAAWAFAICTGQKCENPNCRGLRKAAEFDIQLETEEQLKNSNSLVKDPVKMCSFELPRDHHRQLEDKLKKMAPLMEKLFLCFGRGVGVPLVEWKFQGQGSLERLRNRINDTVNCTTAVADRQPESSMDLHCPIISATPVFPIDYSVWHLSTSEHVGTVPWLWASMEDTLLLLSSLYPGDWFSACFQTRCKNRALCSKIGTTVVSTALTLTSSTDLVLSSRTFRAIVNYGMDQTPLKLGMVDIEYKWVPCENKEKY
ncbi:hypothetical protein Nepgr_028827 [Nepenthes gracilis]|uniref:Expansin-like EG45 domain-containing protein n=1 Tax=Nepenthes gracilis TaxID=150966 RepID=A0AAD3Y4F5_NEPGR|nr:hypothetical protein Nepgr_028827 [Nepenthes gracilis]